VLQPLATRPYRSVMPLPPTRPIRTGLTVPDRGLVTVERRPLGSYAALAEATG
jgi:hypothetical protein